MITSENLPMLTMRKERENPPFDVEEMAVAVHGGKEALELQERVQLELERDPRFANDDIYDLTKDQMRERTFIKLHTIIANFASEPLEKFVARLQVIAVADPGFWTRFGVHLGLFTNAVRSGSTSGQFSYWVSKGMISVRNFYGCFGMTELEHGSNVAGLQTTATLDENSDEFVIHTPNLGATKWWIGGAAQSATHCSVFAQLWVKGKCYGTKTFVVPLRHPDTYELMPGVTIGDIGKKMGRDGIDNGYIQFTHVRIPRAYMLMRYTQVTRDGQVFEPPMQQITYAALLTGRTNMVSDSGNIGKKATTIAIRYAATRRQFKSDPKSQYETQLLDYPIHQRRLLPLLAQSVAFGFTGQVLTAMLNETTSALDALEVGDPKLEETLDMLKATHTTSSGLKAFCTWATLGAIEECRQSLGGHGYSAYTGLAPLYSDFAVHCTWEGDNTILALQAGRALVTSYLESKEGKKQGDALCYLNNLEATLNDKCKDQEQLHSLEGIEKGWLTAAAHYVKLAAEDYQDLIKTGLNREQAYEQCSRQRFAAASVHTVGFIFRLFVQALRDLPAGPVRDSLSLLAQLYGLWQMEEKGAFFLRSGWLSPELFDYVTKRVGVLCGEIRPFAVLMTDSFAFSDYMLNSPMGRWDGNIYEAYFARVQRANPPNKPHPYFERLVKPLIDRSVLDNEDIDDAIGLDEEIDEIQAERREAEEELKAQQK